MHMSSGYQNFYAICCLVAVSAVKLWLVVICCEVRVIEERTVQHVYTSWMALGLLYQGKDQLIILLKNITFCSVNGVR